MMIIDDDVNISLTTNVAEVAGSGCDWSEIKNKPELQDKLISGENIKTVNGNSLLGEGDITIEGGSGNIDDVQVDGVSVVTDKVANIDLTEYARTEDIPSLDGYATEEWVEGKGYLTSYTETDPVWNSEKSNYYTKDDVDGKIPTITYYSEDSTSDYPAKIRVDDKTKDDGGSLYVGKSLAGLRWNGGTAIVRACSTEAALDYGDSNIRANSTSVIMRRVKTGGTDYNTIKVDKEGAFYNDYEIMNTNTAYSKTEIDDMIGDIETLLAEINGGE